MKSLIKALRILNEFCTAPGPLGVSEIASNLGMERSAVSKILRSYRDMNILKQDPESRKYSPDVNLFLLGANYLNQNELAQIGESHVGQLADETGYMAIVCTLHGYKALDILVRQGRSFYDARLHRGAILPWHATAAGQVLVAFRDSGIVTAQDMKNLEKLTDKTILDLRKMNKRLAFIRENGYAITREESLIGLGAICVPVADKAGVVAGLGLVFPNRAVDEKKEKQFIRLLHTVARKYSMNLGAQIYNYAPAS